MDFFTIKGAVEVILKDLRAENVEFIPCSNDPSYHPGRCATVYANGELLGVVGQIHPAVARNYGVDSELYCAELNMPALLGACGAEAQYTPLPKYPAVTRDIAVVCKREITIGALTACIRKAGGKLLRGVELFDIYQGKGVAEDSKSVAFSLTIRSDERNIVAAEADEEIKNILAALEKELGAVLR
jgi:phenylalanyl-tRNA synthetase beta chain